MKKITLAVICFIGSKAFTQTNTFPATGNVGIGTLTPTEALEVNGNAKINGTVFTTQVVITDKLQADTSKMGIIHMDSTSAIVGQANVQGNATVTGNTGLGTAYPTERLDVTGNGIISGFLRVHDKVHIGNSIILDPFDPNGNSTYTDNGDYFIQSNSLYPFNTIFNYGNSGKLGIGTNSPAEKLDVNGNIKASSLSGIGNRAVYADQNGILFSQPTINSLPGPFWQTNGNPGTSSSLNFIGTTDAVDFVFKTANSERMRITGTPDQDGHTGLVGIGVNSPLKQLHIYTEHTYTLPPPNPPFDPCPLCEAQTETSTILSIGSHNGIRVEDKTTVTQQIGPPIQSVFDIEPMFNQLRIGTPLNPIMTLSPGTNNSQMRVGIGTTNPRARLDVAGDIVLGGAGEKFIMYSTSTLTSNNYLQMTYQNNNSAWNFNEGIVLKDNGNVGIGTVGPHSKLHVVGTTSLTGNVDIGVLNLTSGVRLQVATLNGDMAFRPTTTNNPNGYNSLFVVDANTTKALAVHNSTTNQENFIVYGNGQTRIGVQTPINIHSDYQLAVDGKVLAKSFYVTQLNWADDVFSSDYKLMPWENVKQYYTTNKCLPGVQSEKEVKEIGNNVAETDAIFLRKLEEAYLYIDQIKNENLKLKAEIEEIKKIIKSK